MVWYDCDNNPRVQGLEHLRWFHNIVKERVLDNKIHVIWLIVCWSIWSLGNDILFNGEIEDVRDGIINTKVF